MLRRFTLTWTFVALLSTTIGVVACGDSVNAPTAPGGSDDSANDSGNSGGGVPASGTGTLTMAITDSPFSEARAVLVTFNEVSAHRSEGEGWETIAFASGAATRTCDLKKLEGPTDVLGVATLPAGHYTQIRLTVESAAIYFDNPSVSASACAAIIAAPAGDSAPLEVSSGTVKLNRQFTLASGGFKQITLDFDGDKSIRQVGGGRGGNGGGGNGGSTEEDEPSTGRYTMSPVISVVSVQ